MKYGLIGEHLSHSFSKEIHEQIADYVYEITEIEPQNLDAFMKKKDFCAINVTIPYKEAVIPYLDFVDESAMKIGAVNTIVNKGGWLYGYNTDYSGMQALINRVGVDIKGKKVLIIGTGGTSKTARAVCADLGASEIIFASRSKKNGAYTACEIYENHSDTEVIFNTTPVGMYPNNDQAPIELDRFSKLCAVIDVIYNPIRTSLVLKAESLGIKTQGGLYMLAAQAVRAYEHFTESKAEKSLYDSVYTSVLKQKDNIVLIGMPSSGKTTVGKLLSKKTGKTFVDTDEEFVKRTGMQIGAYFENHSEAQFRAVETQIIAELSFKNNLVIATGGGAILNPKNVELLKQNGNIYFLDRSLERLIPTSDRPLSSNIAALKKRYDERYPIYTKTADIKINGNGTSEQVADLIYGEYNK